MDVKIPLRMDIMNRLFNGSNEYGIGWKNRSVVMNENEYKLIKISKIDCDKWY